MASPSQAIINSLATTFAVGAASIAISYTLIPESVIYTKEELANKTILSEEERTKRKLFIAYVIYQGAYKIPSNIVKISNTLSTPAARKHCLVAAQMLSGAPGFALMVKAALKSHRGEELTAKPEDYFTPGERTALTATSVAGSFGAGFIKGINNAEMRRH